MKIKLVNKIKFNADTEDIIDEIIHSMKDKNPNIKIKKYKHNFDIIENDKSKTYDISSIISKKDGYIEFVEIT
jgi:hypothetical protein